jgi:hypothetical protein
MIGTDQVVNGMWVSAILILLGLVPGLYQSIISGISNASNLIPLQVAFTRMHMMDEVSQPRWFAAVGGAILLITFAAYLV